MTTSSAISLSRKNSENKELIFPISNMPDEKWGVDEYFRETVEAVKKFPTWRVLTDIQLAVLRAGDGKKGDLVLVGEKENIRKQRDALQQKFDVLAESFDSERQKCGVLLAEATSRAEEEKRQRLSAEKSLKETVSAKEAELKALRSEHARLREEPDAHKTRVGKCCPGAKAAKESRKES